MEIINLDKITENEKELILHFKIDKDLAGTFRDVLHAFHHATEHICFKIRNNETKKRAIIETHIKETKARHEIIKNRIRTAYKVHRETGLNITEAFKEIRAKEPVYKFLVTEVQTEEKTRIELEIIRLKNAGRSSSQIAEKVGISPGGVRHILWKLKKAMEQ